jgi:hypothetical protein
MNGVYGSDYFPTAAYCRLISLRDGAGERNTIRDVQIDTYDSYQTYQVIRGSQPDIIIDHVNAEIATCNSNKVVLFTNGSSISDNLNVRVIDSTATATSYLLYLYHGNRTDAAIDYVFTDSSFVEQDADNIYYRGIGIIPTTDVVSAAFDNVVVDVESTVAVRIAGDTKTVTVYNDGWRFVDDVSDVSASGTIKYPRNSGSTSGTGSQQTIAHGLFATPSRIYITPTATGADAFVSAAADATNVYVTAGSGKGYKWYAEV